MGMVVWISTTHREEQSLMRKITQNSLPFPRFTKVPSNIGTENPEDETLLHDKRKPIVLHCILFVTCSVLHVILCGPVTAVSF